MPKIKTNPYRLGSPKTANPMKEMSWCFSRHIKVNIEPEAIKEGRDWKMTFMYQLVVTQGDRKSESGYIYTRDNVMDAMYDAYRKIYQMNYGKTTEE
jgi:hypothetical protein